MKHNKGKGNCERKNKRNKKPPETLRELLYAEQKQQFYFLPAGNC